MNCDGCWDYLACKNRDNEKLVACFKKGYTCKYCGRADCEDYDTETRCICSRYIKRDN